MANIELNEKYGNVTLTLKRARIAFSQNGLGLFNSQEYKDSGSFRWGCSLILSDEDKAKVEEAQKLIAKHYKIDLSDLGKNNLALRDGNKNTNKDGEVYDGFEDRFYVSCAKSDNNKDAQGNKLTGDDTPRKPAKPPIVKHARNTITDPLDERVLQDGAYVNAQVNIYFAKDYNTFGVSPTIVVYRDDEYEAFGGGMQEQDADSLYEGSEGSELDEGSGSQDTI